MSPTFQLPSPSMKRMAVLMDRAKASATKGVSRLATLLEVAIWVSASLRGW
jgi:hypothetical protein